MKKLSWGGGVVIIVSVLAVMSFFLPWLSVSSGGQVIHTYSGYKMARGEPDAFVRIDFDGYSILQYVGRPYFAWLFALPWLFVVPSVIGLVLVLACVVVVHHRVGLLTGVAWGLLGMVGLVILALGLQRIRSSYWGDVSFQTHCGLWITMAGLVVAEGGALLTVARSRLNWR